jgi:hypothetical protein
MTLENHPVATAISGRDGENAYSKTVSTTLPRAMNRTPRKIALRPQIGSLCKIHIFLRVRLSARKRRRALALSLPHRIVVRAMNLQRIQDTFTPCI